ncbi:thiamine-phosphate pyrophosphorylase ThiE [Octadecabacter arcticus 238]|uniref:Thiamine-phosphate synthase n=1 Tax=Octadecabacter arcticus 238 TaxID=391616 RepID=M9RGH0_9RHOB|nr:thiamine phosphate synthase [Octadecabacter arcticus]AGI71719.1 thiamine-phosphate pyrophosphorylase ThiE [Octadecabacter arcticus 238]
MMALKTRLRLYLVTDAVLCTTPDLVTTVRLAVANGVTMVQLREKTATTAQRVQMALALKEALAGKGVPLVVNDDVAAAVAADVDGAHIGQGDMSIAQARALLGPDKILGLSCETSQAVQAADPALVDYLGLGPVFGTATKTDHAQPIGLDGLAQLVALSPLPNVAIGGLKATHIGDVHKSGADGMAVVSAICGQADPAAATRAFKALITEEAL